MTQPIYRTPPWAQGAPAAAPAPAPVAPMYKVGDIVNGHQFTGTAWVPYTPPAAPPPPPAAVAPPPPPPPPAAYAPPAPPAGLPAGFTPQVAPVSMGADGFDGIGDAQTFARGVPFPIGEFVIRVDECKANISKNPKTMGHRQFIVIATVLSSNVASSAGAQYSHVIDTNRFGKPDVKNFVGSCLGASPNQPEQLEALNQRGAFSKESIAQILGPQQPFKGKTLRLVTFMNGKGTFTKHLYSPAPAAP